MKNSQGQRDRARIHSEVGKATMERKPGSTRARRGVLLLVVLALLAMFGLIAITYLIITNQARRAAQSLERIDQYANPPELELHQAAMQFLRGSNNENSVMQIHGLLEGLYGADTISGQVASVSPDTIAGGQIVEFAVNNTWATNNPLHRLPGRVLTMTSGNCAGVSTHIVGFRQTATPTWMLQVVASGALQTANLQANDQFLINGAPFSGAGLGFNRLTGRLDATLSIGGGDRSASLLPNPALLSAADRRVVALPWDPTSNPNSVFGGMNVDFTAVDYQHMLLALTLPTGRTAIPSLHRPELVRYWVNQVNPPMDKTNSDQLRANFINKPSSWSVAEWLAFRRRFVLRPLPEDHYKDTNGNGQWDPTEPYFTGSNPAFSDTGYNSVYSSGFNPVWDPTVDKEFGEAPNFFFDFDVDTDGDGKTDSYWMDLGFPVRSTTDGRLYKPLVAVQCVEMDGRFNLNAHGCYAQTEDATSGQFLDYYGLVTPGGGAIFANSVASANLVRGQGYGPAEVNLWPLFSDQADPSAPYKYLLKGYYNNPTDWLDGRYGQYSMLFNSKYPVPGPASGSDYLNANRYYRVPANFANFATVTTYRSPVDPKGTLAIGLDPRGQPLLNYTSAAKPTYPMLPDPAVAEFNNVSISTLNPYESVATFNPYQLNLSATGGRGQVKNTNATENNPFSPAELECILRQYDADAGSLPSRLTSLAPSLKNHRHEITTDSWDLPCPAVQFPKRIADALRKVADGGVLPYVPPDDHPASLPSSRPQHITDLFLGKLELEIVRHDATLTTRAAVESALNARKWNAMAALLPKELLLGLRMDLNRPFGNGADDNANNVADEPGEKKPDDTHQTLTLYSRAGTSHTSQMSLDRSGTVVTANNNNRYYTRQLYARHLYVLALLLMDYQVANPAAPTDPEKQVAQMVAQWAVNVVDFQDSDSIMTPFEYDIAPFARYKEKNPSASAAVENNFWSADGDPTTDDGDWRGVVWGCERPELLITETLATHDRRVENLADEGTWSALPLTTPPAPTWDNDFDQRKKPQGSLFIELFNPWSDSEPRSGDLCDSPSGGVKLDQTANFTVGGTVHHWPVWRMILIDPDEATKDPDPDLGATPPTVERSIYFADPTDVATGISAGSSNGVYYDQLGNDGTVRFYTNASLGAIAPGRYAVIGPGINQSGAYVTYMGRRQSYSGIPEPNDTDTRQIRLTPTTNSNTPVMGNGDGNNDPAAGTIAPLPVVAVNTPRRLNVSEPDGGYPACEDTTNDAYNPVRDRPLDYDRDPGSDRFATFVRTNGTTTNVSIVHLQRLANPLLPYHPTANPYRTIDSMPIDLVAFNGWDAADVIPTGSQGEGATSGTIMFASHQRGQTNNDAADRDRAANLWIQRLDPKTLAASPIESGVSSPHWFAHTLQHSLGYLNPIFGNRRTTAPNLGDPQNMPFPWMQWNNRPFVNAMELLQVPIAKSSKLLNARLQVAPGDPATYSGVFRMARSTATPYTQFNDPFPHLWNFFYSGAADSPELHQLLDLVHVPSPFVHGELQGNPEKFDPNAADTGAHLFYVPFNRIPRYREPGRVNLNAVTSELVFKGLLNRPDYGTNLGNGDIWDAFRESRHPYQTAPDANDRFLNIDPDCPTRFETPFRSFAGTHLNLNPTSTNPFETRPVDASILRGDPPTTGATPLFASNATELYRETNRSPHFRYQAIQRLGNSVTNRSNVFAMWITIGYFQVESNSGGIDVAHPDGFRLGQELGIDTGEVKRHRAFYIIDRTIPVGFQRGVDLNAENTILLKRFIE